MAEAARERELAAELRREKEEQVALGRVDKVRGYKQQKVGNTTTNTDVRERARAEATIHAAHGRKLYIYAVVLFNDRKVRA